MSSVARQFLHNVSAYQTIGNLSPAQALKKFLHNDPAELVKKADPDLKRWVSAKLWEKMHPRLTTEMVRYARHALQTVAAAIEKKVTNVSLNNVPRD